ncbi:MAG: hypothetical protein PVG83_03500 [Acidimicrobiia bacterium]|jgi:hypothetical protein
MTAPAPIVAVATLGISTGEIVEWGVLALLLIVITYWIGTLIPIRSDQEWLPRLVMWGLMAKLAGTFLRYYMAIDLYGTGDAFRYHSRGVAFASIWRSLSVPMSDAGGQGTAFTEVVTGLVYAIYTPMMRGGFLMFAFIAFLGQLLFYAAFRPWLQGKALKRYAIAILFFPSIVFWPASIGKDALMMLFLGLATFGISRMLRRFEPMGLITAGLGLYLAAQVRPHVAIMLALAGALAFLLMRRGTANTGGAKRLVLLVIAVVGLTFAWGVFASDFDVSLEGGGDTADPGAFLESVQNQTAQGGSEVTGGVVSSPLDLPEATLKVIFRPLLNEATNVATAVSAVEGTALLLFVIWRIPTMLRNRRMIRGNPLLLLSFFYTGGFIIAFSSILNLGILARQRVQVLPFLLALLVTLGWPQDPEEPKTSRDRGHRARLEPDDQRIPVSPSRR